MKSVTIDHHLLNTNVLFGATPLSSMFLKDILADICLKVVNTCDSLMVLMSGSLDLGAPSLLRSKPLAGHDLREPTLAIAVDVLK